MYIALVGIVMNRVLAGVPCYRFFMRGVVKISAGSAWVCVDLRGLAWISLDVSGFTSICIELRGQLRRWRGCAWIRKDASRNEIESPTRPDARWASAQATIQYRRQPRLMRVA